jgi:hypothetical protein
MPFLDQPTPLVLMRCGLQLPDQGSVCPTILACADLMPKNRGLSTSSWQPWCSQGVDIQVQRYHTADLSSVASAACRTCLFLSI